MRADLLALSIDSLTLFANAGLVKRAQKEVDGGTGPEIDENADGTVIAKSRDGATTRLARNTTLKDAACSCGAATMCRHRVALVIAYQHLHREAEAGATGTQGWSPAELPDDLLAAACGAGALERARDLVVSGLVVTVRPGPIPTAALPTATVQFVVPHDLTFARCDCSKGNACEHVVVAVWAFRRAPEGGAVELGTVATPTPMAELERLERSLEELVTRGLSEIGSAEALADARNAANRAGLLWIADAFEDLEWQRDAYQRRSATFSARTASLLVAEIGARIRAARGPSPLPARFVLGSDEARETLTDQVRLTPLGVRLHADEDRRGATLYLADRDTKLVFVLRKTWPATPGAVPKNGHELAEQYASSRLTLSSLARGDLLARAARRRANGEIDLSTARGLKSSTLPGGVAWDDLPAPIVVDDLRTLEAAARSAPPRMLSPRRIGEHVRVLRIGRVAEVGYSRGEQTLHAVVEDPNGGRAMVRLQHRSVSPGAIDATYRALEQTPRLVAGELERTAAGWQLSPLAILGERLWVPDIERPRALDLPSGSFGSDDSIGDLLSELGEVVDRGVQKGAMILAGPQLGALADRFDASGMPRVGRAIRNALRPSALLDLAIVRATLDATPISV